MSIFRKKTPEIQPKSSEPKKPSGGHGSHWQAVLGEKGMPLLERIVMNSVQKAETSQKLGDLQTHRARLHELFVTSTITVAGKLYTSYPISSYGDSFTVALNGITEWANGVEAWANFTLGKAGLSAFATDYWSKKELYSSNKDASLKLAGIAYSMLKGGVLQIPAPKQTLTIGETTSMILPMAWLEPEKGWFPDDYTYRGPVLEKREVPGFLLAKVRVANDPSSSPIDVWIAVNEDYVKKETVQIGEAVQGRLWLQATFP